MRPLIATIVAVAAIAAVPAISYAKEKLTPEQKLAKLLEGRVAGPPQRCLSLSRISSSQIFDKTAIVYRSGGTLWVNRPHGGAASLDDDDVMIVRSVGSQLCMNETVTLRARGSRIYSGFVSLGEFVPYKRVETK